jgi:hypothetical protein
MEKMSHLKQYEDAIVKYNKDLQLMLFSSFFDFHYQFVKELKQSISDSRNLKDIALKNKWNSVQVGY